MRIVIALGGNALLKRGESLTAANQLVNIKRAAAQIVQLAAHNDLVITHGNGPQVGLLALQNNAYALVEPYPLDVLTAETQGMIGYLLEQEIANLLPESCSVATLLTRVEVDAKDPAFTTPRKFIGPMYSKEQAKATVQANGWAMAVDGTGYRRVVASPLPQRILGIEPIQSLLVQEMIVIAAGGGGIPVVVDEKTGGHKGIEAVVDKDLCSALLAEVIKADCLLIVTDVNAVYSDWTKENQQAIVNITSTELKKISFPDGSMGPKVKAVCQFVDATHKFATIGSIDQLAAMLQGIAGTRITS